MLHITISKKQLTEKSEALIQEAVKAALPVGQNENVENIEIKDLDTKGKLITACVCYQNNTSTNATIRMDKSNNITSILINNEEWTPSPLDEMFIQSAIKAQNTHKAMSPWLIRQMLIDKM